MVAHSILRFFQKIPPWGYAIGGAGALSLYILMRFFKAYLAFSNVDSGALAPFREDNFWSYSSGFMRRGLSGEFLYWLELTTGQALILYPLLLWLAFSIFALLVMLEVCRTMKPIEVVLFVLSPAYLLFYVDSEIFLLLPFLALLSGKWVGRDYVVIVLVIIATMIREFGILFYAPLLLHYLAAKSWLLRVTSAIVSVGLVSSLFLRTTPTYWLEKEFWPQRGVEGLPDSYLYTFAEMGLMDVLSLHLSWIYQYFIPFGLSVLAFLPLLVLVSLSRGGSRLFRLYVLLLTAMCFILTVDYGRYFYLFFYYMILATHPAVREMFSLAPLSRLWPEKGLGGAAAFRPESIINSYRYLIWGVFIIAPSRVWLGYHGVNPRVVDFTSSILHVLD